MERWRSDTRVRRRAVFALAVLAHVALVGAMLRSRLSHEQATETATVEATIWLPPPPAPRAVPEALPPPRPTRLRSMPHPIVDPRAIRAPLLEAQADRAGRQRAGAAGQRAAPAVEPDAHARPVARRDRRLEADARTVAGERARAVCAVADRRRRRLRGKGVAWRREGSARARRLLSPGADGAQPVRPVQPRQRAPDRVVQVIAISNAP